MSLLFRGARSFGPGGWFAERDVPLDPPARDSASLAALAGAWTHLWDEFGRDEDGSREDKFLNTWIGVTHPENALSERDMPEHSFLDGITGEKRHLEERRANGPWTGVPMRLRKQAFEEAAGGAIGEWVARLKAAVRMGMLSNDVADTVAVRAESEKWIILEYREHHEQRYLVYIRGSANNVELLKNMPWNATKADDELSEEMAVASGMIKQTRHGVVHGGYYVTMKDLLDNTFSWNKNPPVGEAPAKVATRKSLKHYIMELAREAVTFPTTRVAIAGHSKGAAEAWLICASMSNPVVLSELRAPLASPRGNEHPLDAKRPSLYWGVDELPKARACGKIIFIGLGLPPTYFRFGNSKMTQYWSSATNGQDIEIVNGSDIISSNSLTKGTFHRYPGIRTRVYEYSKNSMEGADGLTRTRTCSEDANVVRKDYKIWALRTFQTNDNGYLNGDDHNISKYVLAMAKAAGAEENDIPVIPAIPSTDSAAWLLWETYTI